MYARTYIITVTPEPHGLYHSFVFLSLSYRQCNLICSTPGPHEAFHKELGRLGEPSPNEMSKIPNRGIILTRTHLFLDTHILGAICSSYVLPRCAAADIIL